MPSRNNILRRALGLLAESSSRETVMTAVILIIRAFLPLVAVLLIGHYVDLVTGVADAGAGGGGGIASVAESMAPVADGGALVAENMTPVAESGAPVAENMTPVAESGSGSDLFGGGGIGGVPTGGVPTGGVPSGGVPTGGVPSGGVPTGGVPSGGVPTGGSPLPVAIIWLTMAIVLALLADDLLAAAGRYLTKKHSYLLEGHISSLIHAHAGRLGLRFFEDPLFHDSLERAARDISWRPAALVSDFILLLRGVISFLAMAYVLRNFGLIPLLIVILVFIPVMLVRVRNSRRLYNTRKAVTADSRRASYFSWLLTGEKPAREVKLFDLGGYFDRLFRKHLRASREPELKTERKNILPESFASLLKVAAFAGVIIYATSRYLSSSITAGELAMYLVAFRQAMVYLRDAVSGYSGLAENSIFLRDLFTFLDLKPDMAGELQAPGPDSFSEIAVEKLSFTYPGAVHPALQDITLRIRRGEKVAIVGPNGSGKTTLVKLLCRLYDPDEGRVMVNGSDAASLDPASYRRLFSVVFQNFMLYYLSAGENIMLGSRDGGAEGSADADGGDGGDRGDGSDRADGGDGGAIVGDRGDRAGRTGDDSFAQGAEQPGSNNSASATDELRKAAGTTGLRELLEALPEGYDTQLGHHTEGGRELSWGEWQKIAIARAVYRRSPVLILDEPASSLDADSEYEIFSDLSRITGGRTCIFISHRLSHVRDADRIVVLDGGRVAEAGTHDELMAAGGRYYNMFTRQKSMYR
ncbi:MAG: ABC transporter ATP-binding protein [Bacteroidales bacterium]|nr:ABC transporter ATP-binding protein [Bacteroidales bacterium]